MTLLYSRHWRTRPRHRLRVLGLALFLATMMSAIYVFFAILEGVAR